MADIHVGAWLGSWHRWLIDNETVIDHANYFPNADRDTGKNFVANTRLFAAWDETSAAPTIVSCLQNYWRTHEKGASSAMALRAFMAPLAEMTQQLGVTVPASALAQVAAESRYGCDYRDLRTRPEAAPAALGLISDVLSRWPVPLAEVEDEIIRVLDRSRVVNLTLYPEPDPPPDAGTLAWTGLLRVSLDLLIPDLAEERQA